MRRRNAFTGFGMVGFFTGVVMALLHFMPPPLRSSDYLMIGGVATVASMAALFVFLIATTLRTPDVFYRRR